MPKLKSCPLHHRKKLALAALLVLAVNPSSAQVLPARDGSLAQLEKTCQALVNGPPKSAAEIRNYNACIASGQLLLESGRPEIESPAIQISARRGEWEFRYVLDGRSGEERECTLTTDIALPVGRTVRVTLTSDDMIHAWLIPALGIKADAIPGRLSEVTLRGEAAGLVNSTQVRNAGSSTSQRTLFTVRLLAEADYAQWERTTLRSKGCGRG